VGSVKPLVNGQKFLVGTLNPSWEVSNPVRQLGVAQQVFETDHRMLGAAEQGAERANS